MTTSHRVARAAYPRLLSLLLLGACGGEELPPYRPPPMGTQEQDGGLRRPMSVGANVNTPGDIDMLPEIRADQRDPKKICTSWIHSCAIDGNGKVWCWPTGGRATTPPVDLPPQKAITCGIVHTCALDEEGVVTCWGHGDDPDTPPGDMQRQGQAVVPEGRYKEISAGGGGIHTCAIDIADELVCWGAGGPDKGADAWLNYGQARPPAGKFMSVVAGDAHSCAIRLDNGEVMCWGGEGDGRCFPSSGFACGQLNTPLGSYEQLAAGAGHTCALNAAGGVRCWGSGLATDPCDPFNDGSLKECGQSRPPGDTDAPFAFINAGSHTTCGITEDYEAHCWGWGEFGQTDVPEGEFFSQIAPGDLHTCAIGVNGVPVCWGDDDGGKTRVPFAFPEGRVED